MTDPQPSPLTAPLRRWHWLLAPLLLVLVALTAWRGLEFFRNLALQQDQLRALTRDLNQAEAQLARLAARQEDLLDNAQASGSRVEALAQRLETYDQTLGELGEQLQGGRVRAQLAVIEQLLLTANERAQLAQDSAGALAALELADERLALLKEPRLYRLREILAQERAALQALPPRDTTVAALTLASLIARLPQLPLASRLPDRSTAAPAPPPAAGLAEGLWQAVRKALAGVFSLRRANGPPPRLLPEAEEAVVMQVLTLKLEAARVALLRGDEAALRDTVTSARQWLRSYYRAQDPGVQQAQAELERLGALSLGTPLPDLTRSLAQLRAYSGRVSP